MNDHTKSKTFHSFAVNAQDLLPIVNFDSWEE